MSSKTINVFTVGADIGPLGSGAVVSTGNLMRVLAHVGNKVNSFKLASKTGKSMRSPKHGGYDYRLISMEDALKLVRNRNYINIISHWSVNPKDLPPVVEMINAGCTVFLRQVNDMRDCLIEAWQKSGSPILTIRQRVSDMLMKLHGLESTAIPHIYIPSRYKRVLMRRHYNAVTINRIAGVKRMDMVLDANKMMPEDKRIHMFGVESRQYTHFKLDKDYPDWRNYYHGQFKIGEGVRFAKQSKFVVDMSDMGEDGGGTQNTFLEAWEAGAVLVLNKAWFLPDGVVTPDHAVFAGSAEELATFLQMSDKAWNRIRAKQQLHSRKLLASRTPEKIARLVLDALGKE